MPKQISFTSTLIARLLGPMLIAISIAMLLNRNVFQHLIGEFIHSHALIFISGILTLLGGLAIVNTHNIWVRDWRTILTVFGWLAVIGGVVRIILPQFVTSVGEAFFSTQSNGMIAGGILLLLGGYISLMGYRKV